MFSCEGFKAFISPSGGCFCCFRGFSSCWVFRAREASGGLLVMVVGGMHFFLVGRWCLAGGGWVVWPFGTVVWGGEACRLCLVSTFRRARASSSKVYPALLAVSILDTLGFAVLKRLIRDPSLFKKLSDMT